MKLKERQELTMQFHLLPGPTHVKALDSVELALAIMTTRNMMKPDDKPALVKVPVGPAVEMGSPLNT